MITYRSIKAWRGFKFIKLNFVENGHPSEIFHIFSLYVIIYYFSYKIWFRCKLAGFWPHLESCSNTNFHSESYDSSFRKNQFYNLFAFFF